MKSIAAIVLLLLIGINSSLSAAIHHYYQDTTIILPNGKWIKGEKLQPYHQSLNTFSVNNGQEVKTGSVDDTFSVITINKKKYALRIAKIVLPGREILDSGLVDLNTFKPVYHHSHQTTKTMLLQFGDQQVGGTVQTTERTDTISMHFDYPLFDSYYETLIARTIELRDGFLFKYPDFIYEEGGLVWQSGKVERSTASSGKEIWIISYVDSKSGRRTTYWIDNKRNLIQLQYQFGERVSVQKPV